MDTLISKVFKHQAWHFLFIVFFSLVFFIVFEFNAFLSGQLWGISTSIWALWAISAAVFHHIYVLLTWRLEMYYHILSKSLGKYTFLIYEIGFFLFFFGRIILIFLLAFSNASTLSLLFPIRVVIIIVIAIPMFYTFYSVIRYFGIHRAAGADHFLQEYREKPFEKRGIYRYSSNAMYKYAIGVVWIPGLLLGSVTALLVALFNHLYVWVHYFTLEKPDLKILFGTHP